MNSPNVSSEELGINKGLAEQSASFENLQNIDYSGNIRQVNPSAITSK